MVETYDEESLRLAQYFLLDEDALNTPDWQDHLAKTIQSAVEDWFGDRRYESTLSRGEVKSHG